MLWRSIVLLSRFFVFVDFMKLCGGVVDMQIAHSCDILIVCFVLDTSQAVYHPISYLTKQLCEVYNDLSVNLAA